MAGEGEGERPVWTRVRRRPQVSELLDELVELEARQDEDQQRLDDDQLYAVAIGAVVQEQRLWLGWPQDRLAEEAGVSVKTIWRLEGGRGDMPSMRCLRRIAAALTLELSELLEQAEQQLDEEAAPPISHRSPAAL